MMVLFVLGCILLALGLLSLVRVGGDAEYGTGGFTARLRLGLLRITIWPVKKKKEKRKKAESPPPPPDTPPPEEKPKAGGSFVLLRELLPFVTDAAGRLTRKIRIDLIRLDFTAAATDPAEAALAYGGANAAIGMIWPLIEHNFKVKDRRIRTRVDFDAKSPTVYVFAAFSLTIGQAVSLGTRLFVRFLKTYRHAKQKQKEAV